MGVDGDDLKGDYACIQGKGGEREDPELESKDCEYPSLVSFLFHVFLGGRYGLSRTCKSEREILAGVWWVKSWENWNRIGSGLFELLRHKFQKEHLNCELLFQKRMCLMVAL